MIKESIASGKSMISDEQLTNLSLRLFSSVSTWINKTNNSFYEIVKMNDPIEGGGLNAKLNECLLVEGYTDLVSLHQAGIENVRISVTT